MQLMRLLRWISKRRFPYEPLIAVFVSRGRLLRNLERFRKLAKGRLIAPVLKSNAYGHGLIEVAGILEGTAGIPFFVVDSYFEAVALRAQRIKTPLLIIGYNRPDTILCSNLRDVAFTVTSMETLKKLSRTEEYVRIHLKIDTGMNRQGILPEEIPAAMDMMKENPLIQLDGICTHFSDADNSDESYTDGQIHIWNRAAKLIKANFPGMKHVHAANTDGSRFSPDIEANVIRLGIGLYGLSENPAYAGGDGGSYGLEPALEMTTIMTGVKKIERDATVGYGNTFKAEKPMTLATVPVGYFEGLDRRISNKGALLVGPDRVPCPIVGRVSMNITTLDVSQVPDVAIGMPVVVMSNNPNDPNSMVALARACGTISYELAVKIPAHLKRIIVD